MPVVAIAGGSSASLGRSLVVALLEKPTSPWTPIILSRSSRRPDWLKAIDADKDGQVTVQVKQVDYDSTESLASALTESEAHTCLSVILTKDPTQPRIMLNILEASVRSGCKRFVPSYWGAGSSMWDIPMVDMFGYATKGVWEACLKAESETKRGIRVSRFLTGSHMNYLGIGLQPAAQANDTEGLKAGGGYVTGDDVVCQGVDREGDMPDKSGSFLISSVSKTAELLVTNDGKSPRMTFTLIRDIGRFVRAVLDIDDWPHDMNIVGDTLPLDQVLHIVQGLNGSNFNTTHLSAADLKTEIADLEEQVAKSGPNRESFMKKMWAQIKLACTLDEKDKGWLEPTVNRMCPELRPMSVQEYMQFATVGK